MSTLYHPTYLADTLKSTLEELKNQNKITEDIKNKQEKDRMFDITVDVYESKSMSEADFQNADISTSFNEDNHLITVTSTSSQ